MNRFEFPLANSGTSEDDESTNFNVSHHQKLFTFSKVIQHVITLTSLLTETEQNGR